MNTPVAPAITSSQRTADRTFAPADELMTLSIDVVGALGYSRGEDKCMLPAEVATDPQKARGSLIGAVLRDGDWNICIKYASDNKIPPRGRSRRAEASSPDTNG